MTGFKTPLGSILDSITQYTTLHQKQTQLHIMQNKEMFLGHLRMMASVMKRENISHSKHITDMVEAFEKKVGKNPENARDAFEELGDSLMMHAGRDIDLCSNPKTVPYLKNFLREGINVAQKASNAVLEQKYSRIALFIKEVGEMEAKGARAAKSESVGVGA